MKQSKVFKGDYDLGFLDDQVLGLMKVKKESKIGLVLTFIAIVVVIAAWVLLT